MDVVSFISSLSPEQRPELLKALNAADSLLRTNSSHERVANHIGQLLEAISQIQHVGRYTHLSVRPRKSSDDVFGNSSLIG